MNLPAFWSIFTKVVGGLIGQKAHAEVILTLHDGQIRFVKINRTYTPENLPNI